MVAAHMTREQVQKILAPEGYVGLCGEICDQVVAHIRSDNEAKAKALIIGRQNDGIPH